MTEDYQALRGLDLPQRPENFEFALDFLGDPEASELRAYIEQLETIARASLAEPAPPANETMSWIGQAVARAIDEQMPEAVEPIPLSERKPRPEDCDGEGRVWLYRPQTPILNPYWDLVKLDYIDPVPPTHWLPANALPLPQEEVQP